MVYFAMVMFGIALFACILGLGRFAGLSVEIGWLFGALALTFLVAAARLNDAPAGGLAMLDADEEASTFGPHIRMRMTPVSASAGQAVIVLDRD